MKRPRNSGAAKGGEMVAAVDWLRDAFGHLEAIGFDAAAKALIDKAGIKPDGKLGIVALDDGKAPAFIAAAKKHKIWDREELVRPPR